MTALGERVLSVIYSSEKFRVSEFPWFLIKMLISSLDVNKGHCLSIIR
jgi:hypothetical protein